MTQTKQRYGVQALLCIVLAVQIPAHGEPLQFRHYFVDANLPGSQWGQTALVDIDRDGDLDFITGRTNGDIRWYEFNKTDNTWAPHLLGRDSPSDVGGVAMDVDEDGRVDFVAGGAWYRQPTELNDAPWARHVFDEKLVAVHDIVAADLDGDGRPEVATLSDKSDLRYYRIPAGQETDAWPMTKVWTGVHAGLAAGDLDGDGDVDLVRSQIWLENQGRGTRWKERQFCGIPWANRREKKFYYRASRSWIADINRDGRLDIVLTENEIPGGRIAWFEAPENAKQPNWKPHFLTASDDETRGPYHSLQLADFDSDGDLDVFAGEMEWLGEAPHRWFIWENANGDGSKFVERVILDKQLGTHETQAGDVDGDGDIDLVGKLWRPRPENGNRGRNHVDFLENLLVNDRKNNAASRKSIQVWYGQQQRFGHLGRAQRWINVLGRVSEPDGLSSATMRVNDGESRPLTIGSDTHRLADDGDFNAELAWEELRADKNRLQVKATWQDGTSKHSDVEIEVARETKWALPYYVDFRNVHNLQDVVQVVDGKWRLTPEGVRTSRPYYDRVLAMGDRSWENYEATIRFTLHGFAPPQAGPPTYNVTHVGVALRWRGHTKDGRQPSRQWYPLGAQGEFLIKPDLSQCQWRVLPSQKQRTYARAVQKIDLNQPLRIKAQVATISSGDTRYRFKLWAEGEPEPLAWGVEHIEKGDEDFPSGSLCLVPHNTDVTYHEIRVEPLVGPVIAWSARPGPGALHYSALAGGVRGARGDKYEVEAIPNGAKLQSIQVSLSENRQLVQGIRLSSQRDDGSVLVSTIGTMGDVIHHELRIPEERSCIGISGASGWFLDRLQFDFDDGTNSPRYGGSGGDTTFQLRLQRRNGKYVGRLRGFHGTSETAIETIGLIFDPAE